MAWSAPASPWTAVAEVMTAAKMNILADDVRYLKGLDGAVTIDNDLTSVLAAGGSLTAQATNNGSFARLRLLTKRTSGTVVDWRLLANGLSDAGELVFYDQTAGTERMRIDNAGNVGIGYTAPQGKLHVGVGAGGGMVYLAGTISGTLNTLAVAGTVTVMAAFWGMIRNNGGSTLSFIGLISANLLALGGNFIVNCNTAADQVTIAVTAGGAITAQRTAGANSHQLNMLVFYV